MSKSVLVIVTNGVCYVNGCVRMLLKNNRKCHLIVVNIYALNFCTMS